MVLAMQVLGGDPETAYVAVVCAVGYAIGLGRGGSGAWRRPWLWGPALVAAALGWAWAGPHLAPRIHGSGGRWGPALLAAVWALGLLVYAATRQRTQRGR